MVKFRGFRVKTHFKLGLVKPIRFTYNVCIAYYFTTQVKLICFACEQGHSYNTTDDTKIMFLYFLGIFGGLSNLDIYYIYCMLYQLTPVFLDCKCNYLETSKKGLAIS